MKLVIISFLVILIKLVHGFDVCSDKQDGTFLKDYSSCNGYLTCSSGYAYKGYCGDGFSFNPKSKMCDYPENVECNDVCPSVGLTAKPYPSSCTKFIQCFAGEASYHECPAGLYFDAIHENCNIKEKVDCVADICPDGDVTTLIASAEDCATYYICEFGHATRRRCPDGLFYNPDKFGCDHSENVQCTMAVKPLEEEIVNEPLPITCPPTGKHLYPNPDNCSYYYVCINGVARSVDCGPAQGYDYVFQRCDAVDQARCIKDLY